MINSIEDLRSAGVLPTGPVSAWPKERNIAGPDMKGRQVAEKEERKVTATAGQMARGLVRSAGQALKNGRVKPEIREERMATCKSCPFFTKDERCSSCGCFMPAKSWIGGNPRSLCPHKKWKR